MNIVTSQFTVAEYCRMMERGEATANRDYQRSDKVWPDAAASFLINACL